MHELSVVHILLFFSFIFDGMMYPCALVHWFSPVGEKCDKDTGMWMVEPEVEDNSLPTISVVHINCIYCAAHLLPIYGNDPIPLVPPHDSLDVFAAFYVNKYVNHHAFQIAF
jgi:hypothetical protein